MSYAKQIGAWTRGAFDGVRKEVVQTPNGTRFIPIEEPPPVCPSCARPVRFRKRQPWLGTHAGWHCDEHGHVVPVWPDE